MGWRLLLAGVFVALTNASGTVSHLWAAADSARHATTVLSRLCLGRIRNREVAAAAANLTDLVVVKGADHNDPVLSEGDAVVDAVVDRADQVAPAGEGSSAR